MNENRIDYRYDECGLDNVVLADLPVAIDDNGDETITIPNIGDLHRLLTYEVATKEGGLAPKEIRFLRTEMGMSQAELAQLVGRDGQTVGRWERAETEIDPSAETVLRLCAIEHVKGQPQSVQWIAERTTFSANQVPLVIDAGDPSHYRRRTAA